MSRFVIGKSEKECVFYKIKGSLSNVGATHIKSS